VKKSASWEYLMCYLSLLIGFFIGSWSSIRLQKTGLTCAIATLAVYAVVRAVYEARSSRR